MLIGVEFKRKKVYLEDEGRYAWFWRVAPYIQDVEHAKFYSVVIFVVGMLGVLYIGSCVRHLQQ